MNVFLEKNDPNKWKCGTSFELGRRIGDASGLCRRQRKCQITFLDKSKFQHVPEEVGSCASGWWFKFKTANGPVFGCTARHRRKDDAEQISCRCVALCLKHEKWTIRCHALRYATVSRCPSSVSVSANIRKLFTRPICIISTIFLTQYNDSNFASYFIFVDSVLEEK